MPYNYDPNLDENADQTQGGAQGNTQLAGGGTVTGGASSTVAAGGNTPGSPSPTHPSNFQDLNAYLDANSGNGFGQKFLGNVNNDVNAAQSAQDQGASLFKGASDAGTTKANPDIVNQAISDPYGFSQNPENVSSFQSQLNAQYKGPQSYSDDQSAYQTAYGATQKAEDTAKAAQSEGGRFALLNNYFGTPNYNEGQQSLDNLLVQGDKTTAQGIQQARANADQSQINFQNQAAPLQQYAAQNNATTQATKKGAQDATNTSLTGMQSDYAKALSDAQTNQTNSWNNAQAALAGGPSKYGELSKYGVTSGPKDPYTGAISGNSPGYWGVDAGTFVNQGIAPNASNVLSLPQQQKLDALQGLSGNPQTPFNAAESGTYDPSKAVNFRTGDFNTAMQTAADNYGQAQSGILGNIQQVLEHPTDRSGQIKISPQIQAQYDQLNKIRQGYGLAPVVNPYTDDFGTGGIPVG